MQAKVYARRHGGRQYAWVHQPPALTGELFTVSRESPDGYRTQAITLKKGDAETLLIEPKLRSITGGEVTFIGLEKVEYSWVMQEWVWQVGPRYCCYCHRSIPVDAPDGPDPAK